MTEAEQITAASRSNLALAFVALPKPRRRDISIFYAFCRVVDDIADGPASRDEKERLLHQWRNALREPMDGEPTLAAPVRAIIARYGLAVGDFEEIIAGVEMDLDPVRFETWEELSVYCHRVASVVGLVSIGIFGAKDPGARGYALKLGLALQVTNILRDVGQDFANGERVYLPEEDLVKFGVSIDAIRRGERSSGFIALMDFEADRAEKLFAEACLPHADRNALIAAEIMRAVYHRLLQNMRKDRWHVFDRRYRLNKATKVWLVLKTIGRTFLRRV